MTTDELLDWKNFAVSLAQKTKKLLLEDNSSRGIALAQGKDIKLFGDKLADDFIIKELKEKSPFSILAEESGQYNQISNIRWIIDPLDGSMNYSRSIPLCCISIALWQEMTPLLGIICDLNRDELYVGMPGRGAMLNDHPIFVSSITNKMDAVLATGLPVSGDYQDSSLLAFFKNVQTFKKIRMIGSAALSLAYVASGKIDGYLENRIRLWDVAAGLAIVKAAGGEIAFTPCEDDTIVNVTATNGKLR